MAQRGGSGKEKGLTEAEFMAQLRSTFEQMPEEIPLYMFVDRGRDDVFAQTIRQIVRFFRQLTNKITFREYPMDHELARKWHVAHSPTLLVWPERYPIRWLGAPMGEEGRIFLEMMLMMSAGKSHLNEASRKVLGRIEGRRQLKVFVSPTCPYCPQQALNGVQAVIERPDKISLEIVDIQANPDLAEKYQAHSVPQTFTNEVLTGMGAQSQEIFCASIQKMEPQTVFIPEVDEALIENDVVIVGGGPAGLTAGIYAVRSGLKAGIVERDALGGQVATTPIVENYTGFSQVGGKNLVDIMVSHALQYTQIFQGEEVLDIQPGKPIVVQTSRRKFHTRAVLLATGATHRTLGVAGEKRFAGKGVSYCSTCDGPLFVGKQVLMVGGGNSAVTEALHLHHMGVKVTLVHRRDSLRAQDVLIQGLKDAGIPILWNTEIKEIRGENAVSAVDLVNNQTQAESTVAAQGVFVAVGYVPAVGLAEKIGVALNPDGYIRHDRHRTNVPGIYSAGDVEGGYKQIITATGQGAEAAMAIFEDLIQPYWEQKTA